MNLALWILGGAALGWAGVAYFNINQTRGIAIAAVIGALGGFIGGNELAPMLGAVTDTPNVFNLFSMSVALASAAGCLAVSHLVSRHYGV